LFNFKQKLPCAKVIFSDENFSYQNVFGNKNIAAKGKETNLIESFNSQLRQYCSKIKRKSKSFAKDFINFDNHLAWLFIEKKF
jgi:IS1 family transposase